MVLDHADHDLVADEGAGVHDLLGLDAERGLLRDLLAKHVARGEMADTELVLDVGRLRTLAWRAGEMCQPTLAHCSSSPSTPDTSVLVVRRRLLTRAWGTHEDHAQLWGCRNWGRRRWCRLCLLLEVVYPVLKTFCERPEVLELILPTRWHLTAARRRRKRGRETSGREDSTRTNEKQGTGQIRHASRTQTTCQSLLWTDSIAQIIPYIHAQHLAHMQS